MSDTDQLGTITEFSVRGFLAERKALVIHFSTPMRADPNLRFPDDLQRAQTLSQKGLCCSIILASDVGPHDPNISSPDQANAVGSVGIILEVNDADSVCAVDQADCGTSRDPTRPDDPIQYGGEPPTAQSCARSIDKRETSNEWVVKNFKTAGVFLFEPLFVHTLPAGSPEKPIDLEDAIAPFPDLRVFSTKDDQFIEWNRGEKRWFTVGYTSIIEPIEGP